MVKISFTLSDVLHPVPVPEKFEYFSNHVSNQLKVYSLVENLIIPLNSEHATLERLNVLFEFFELLKENPPTIIDESASDKERYAHLSPDYKVMKIEDWSFEFLESKNKDLLIDCSTLASYLGAQQFIEYFALFFASKLREKDSIEKMRDFLNMDNDLTLADFEALSSDSEWLRLLTEAKLT